MSFTSYAQNYEDVMLWRVLRDVGPGFYIDVGAGDPEIDSITAAFSRAGWRGINIEPEAVPYARLLALRGRDINLDCAISDRAGDMEFYHVEGHGLSTLDAAVAAQHRVQGRRVRRTRQRCRMLAEVWAAHVPAGQPVHFLKVDVEGHERAVLAGLDWARQRPWLVVVEATAPQSPLPTHAQWEPLLLHAGYVLLYEDGLNRFYADAVRADALRPHFRLPPNVFDDFMPAVQVRQAAEIARLHAHIQQQEARLAACEGELRTLTYRVARRLTAPFRILRRMLTGSA